jgi:hypothetical protein
VIFLFIFTLLTITVIIHSMWMFWVMKRINMRTNSPHRIILRNVLVIATALLAHIAEAGAFAGFYLLSGALDNWEAASYFSLVSYATLGYGDVTLPAEWRLVGAAEGLVGALMVGWSVAVLVVFLQQLKFMFKE